MRSAVPRFSEVGSLLPKTAVVGRVARVTGGWALDVQHQHAGKLVEDWQIGGAMGPRADGKQNLCESSSYMLGFAFWTSISSL